MDKRPADHLTRALVTFAILLFFLTELVVVTVLWNIPASDLNLGMVTKYMLPIVASLPMAVGVKGFITAKRRLLSTDLESSDTISRQFLTTITIAYAVIIFMISVVQR